MSHLTLPLVGLTAAVGYLLNQDGKAPRKTDEVRQNLEQFEKPNGTNVYTSNKVAEVNKEMLDLSLHNYKLAESPEITGVLPPLFNTYSSVGNKEILKDTTKNGADIPLHVHHQINKVKDVLAPAVDWNVGQRPMFTPFDNLTPLDNSNSLTSDSNVSLLTGLPLEKTHNNMVPFFGSASKQNVEEFTNEPLLDRYTGRSSTFAHKQEMKARFETQSQDIYGTPLFTDNIGKGRYIPSRFIQNNNPFEERKENAPIAGTVENNIRPTFKTVNELRPGNRPKETYDGRMLSGKMGEVRGIQNSVEKNRPDTFYESTKDHLFVTTGEHIAPKMAENFSNLKTPSRGTYNTEYFGIASSSEFSRGKQRLQVIDNSDQLDLDASFVQNPKRNNFGNDYLRNVNGRKLTNDIQRASINVFETERATTGDITHQLNANMEKMGQTTRLIDGVKSTIKETMLSHDNSGHIKTTFDSGAVEAFRTGVSNMTAKTTSKEMTVDNKYIGNSQKASGMGYLVNKYSAKTTGKEIISADSEYTGGANGHRQSSTRVHYSNFESRPDKEESLVRDRASGPQKFGYASGVVSQGELQVVDNLLLKEQEDRRLKMNVNVQQVIPSKAGIGYVQRFRHDDDAEDLVFSDRLDASIVNQQLSANPYSMYGNKSDE